LPKYRIADVDFDDYPELTLEAEPGRPPKTKHVPKKAQSAVLNEIVEATGLEGGFNPTYVPAKYEKVWLLSSLGTFYEQHLISDVLALVKGGKEATVYRCQAYPESGLDLVAAKVYRPRQFRNLRNDKAYREGRNVLTGEGRVIKKTDARIMRALNKKTAFGEQVAHSSWLLHEYTTLQKLFAAGAAVPEPYAVSDNVIVMEYIGDRTSAAPPLHEIVLSHRSAKQLFEEVLRNVELILQLGFVHGDLSAFNILYWEGRITLIDFPQVSDIFSNPNAQFFLERDLQRVCEYFERYGVRSNPRQLAENYWKQYGKPEYIDELLAELDE
jgi:RIO kinase 1